MTFEQFLREKHAEEYVGTDDNMGDDFDNWLVNAHIDNIVEFAEEWHRYEMDSQKIKLLSNKFTYCAYCGKEFEIDKKGSVEEVTKHIHECDKHPIADYKAWHISQMKEVLERVKEATTHTSFCNCGVCKVINEELEKLG